MNPEIHTMGRSWFEALLIFVGIVLVVLCAVLVWQIFSASRGAFVEHYHHHRFPRLSGGMMATTTDVSVVRSWMTFDYVNQIFSLPPAYLQTTLSISDTHYPLLTISGYARDIATTTSSAVSLVQHAISDHLQK